MAEAVTIGLIGAAGRMGLALQQAVSEAAGATLSGGIDAADHPGQGQPLAQAPGLSLGTDPAALARASRVLIDFSAPAALAGNLAAARDARAAVVIGTTGLDAAHHDMIDDAAREIPVLQAANMSLGVNLLAALVEQAAARLGADWDIEILEMHHRHKVDAPSGTALLFGNAAAQGRGIELTRHAVYSREGITGPRPEGSIGFATLRGGSVPGDHSVIFAAEDERVELSHFAQSRMIFVRGAVKAALWLAAQPAGRYGMRDVLGIEDRF